MEKRQAARDLDGLGVEAARSDGTGVRAHDGEERRRRQPRGGGEDAAA